MNHETMYSVICSFIIIRNTKYLSARYILRAGIGQLYVQVYVCLLSSNVNTSFIMDHGKKIGNHCGTRLMARKYIHNKLNGKKWVVRVKTVCV